MVHLNLILQIANVTLLVLVCVLLLRYTSNGLNSWTGIGLTLGIICYMIAESEVVQEIGIIRTFVAIGAICIPGFFWMLARAIFDDHFRFRWSLLIWFFVLVLVHLDFFVGEFMPWKNFHTLASVLARLTSLGFVLAGVYAAVRTRQSDLVENRIKFRNIFLLGTAALIGVTLIVELIRIDRDSLIALQVLQRSAIFVITLYFLVSNFDLRPGFFFKEVPKVKATTTDDPQMNVRLQALMEIQKVYKNEGLTIGQLAELMNEQEYRLRRLINGQLGFRNFNDFLNQYRVKEACQVLSDPNQSRKTILEIAYDLGYQSIGPFNKAFKELQGVTPTAYRKSRIT